MTSTANSTGVRSISAYRARAAALPEGTTDRAIADLRADELQYLLCVQWARANISVQCDTIQAIKDGVANMQRPYLIWDCCDYHRSLKAAKAELLKRAEALGIELRLDATTPIID